MTYIIYLAVGIAIGYLVTLGVTSGLSPLDRARHDLELKKEWIKMQGAQK
jgi:HAMP domain-containing protein